MKHKKMVIPFAFHAARRPETTCFQAAGHVALRMLRSAPEEILMLPDE